MNYNFSKKTISFFLIFFLIFLFFTFVVGAAERPGFERIRETIDNVWRISLIIVGIIAVGTMIFAGLRWAFSAGDANAITEAKKSILSVFVGLLIVMFSVYLLDFLKIRVEIPDPPKPVVIPDPIPEIPPFVDGIILTRKIKSLKSGKPIHHVPTEQIRGGQLNIRNLNRIIYGRELAEINISRVEFRNPPEHYYGVIVFEEPGFRGRCEIITQDKSIISPPGSIRSFIMPLVQLGAGSITFYNYPHNNTEKKTVGLPTYKPIFDNGRVIGAQRKIIDITKKPPLYEEIYEEITGIVGTKRFCPFSIETTFLIGESLIVLRNEMGECYVIQGNVANTRDLWWARAFGGKSCPFSGEAINILRIF